MHLPDARTRLKRSRRGDRNRERHHRARDHSHGAYYNPAIKRAFLAAVVVAAAAACRPGRVAVQPDAARDPIARLRGDIDRVLAAPPLARSYWGVLVTSLKTGETLYAMNARKLFVPASNMKIATLAAAAEKLGWDYTYATTVRATGRIDNGILDGDLVVVGTGDPSLVAADGMSDRVFADWAARLKAAGIHVVAGRIVGDGTALGEQPFGDGWMWDDLVDEYSAGVAALQLNEDAVRLTIAPGPSAGASAAAALAPFAAALTVDNEATTSAAGTDPSIHIQRLPGESRLEITGTIPLGHAPITSGVSVADPTRFFVDSLRAALIRNGIDVRQSSVVSHQSSVAAGRTIVEYRSPPLSTLAVRLMKISQNQYAETLFRTIGGREAVLRVLQPWGIEPNELVQRDGSGLSRYDLVTPQAFVAILTHIDGDPKLREPFERSLPVAGDVGLATRMKGTPAEGNARAKTGSMTGVRTLSGFVATADREPLVFSILANNFEVEPATVNAATDAIVVRLAEFTRGTTPAASR